MASLFVQNKCRDCFKVIDTTKADERCPECRDRFESYASELWGLGDQTETRERLWRLGTCWKCVEDMKPASEVGRVDSSSPLCDTCSRERLQESRVYEPNPYKRAWANQDEIEQMATEWAKNDILFCPSYETMAVRHSDKARFLLRRARVLGRSAAGWAIFREAMVHVRLAKSFAAQADYINRRLK